MKNASATLLEIYNHIASAHPELNEHFFKINPNFDNFDHADIGLLHAFKEWKGRKFSMPCPHFIKQANVLRQGCSNATWIETGTYLGDTTALLAATGNKVYSIEPEINLFHNAVKRFQNVQNVFIINELSENALPKLLSTLNGDINFWLDGHFSAGITFEGPLNTPLTEELKSISENLNRFSRVVVIADDIRGCDSQHSEYNPAYPSLDYLVDWARSNSLTWRIEHDSFIAKRL